MRILLSDEIRNKIECCTTSKQVLRILDNHKIKYFVDKELVETALDNGCPKSKALDLKIGDNIRIYYSRYDNGFVVQDLIEYKMVYNGKKKSIPLCYGIYKEIDDYDIIKVD